MTTDTLPWDAVSSDSDDIPFDALQQIADALPRDPAILDRLYDTYMTAQERHWREGGFEFVYIPGIIALGAEKLSGDVLKEAIMVVLDWLDETPEDADLDFEILHHTLEAIGPAVLPYTVDRLRERDPADSQCFYLRGLLAQLARTDDPALRKPAVEYCRETIDAALAGQFDADLTIEQALALLPISEPGLREKLKTLEQLTRDETRPFNPSANEFRHMLGVIDGNAELETVLGNRNTDVPDWIGQYQQMIREWRSRPDMAEADGEADDFFDSPMPEFEHADHLQPIVREQPRVGRNEPCLCGSGKKYKKCCGK